MGSTILDVDVSALAGWLDKEAGDRLWTVDGEPWISGLLDLPCPGRELAATLKKLGGRVRVFGQQGAQVNSPAELAKLAAHEEDGARVFEVAWLREGAPGEHWILSEDTIAEKAEAERAEEEARLP